VSYEEGKDAKAFAASAGGGYMLQPYEEEDTWGRTPKRLLLQLTYIMIS